MNCLPRIQHEYRFDQVKFKYNQTKQWDSINFIGTFVSMISSVIGKRISTRTYYGISSSMQNSNHSVLSSLTRQCKNQNVFSLQLSACLSYSFGLIMLSTNSVRNCWSVSSIRWNGMHSSSRRRFINIVYLTRSSIDGNMRNPSSTTQILRGAMTNTIDWR